MSEQEPNGWELLRAIKGIETRLDNFGANYVPLSLFGTLVERVKTVEIELDAEESARARDLAKERAERESGDAALREEIEEARKTKAQQWFSIGLLAVGAAITLLVSLFKQSAGLP